MSDYTLSAKITADISGFSKSIQAAKKTLQSFSDACGSVGKNLQTLGSHISTIGALFTGVETAAAAAAVGIASKAVSVGASFEDSMANVRALSSELSNGSKESAAKLATLTKEAKRFGNTTKFTATQAADAFGYMALAGWDTEKMLNGIDGVLNLAAASGMELAQASDIVTDYLSAFSMEAKQAAYFSDLLAYAQANSNTTVEELSAAYKNCAANLNAAGQDVETVTACLEAMANQGKKGSEAGTQLKAVMRDITSSMENGAIAIGNTSVAVADEYGKFRDLTDILLDVESACGGMGNAEKAAALSVTFTDEAVSGLNLLLNEGVGSIAGYKEALRNSGGTAESMADTLNSTLTGQFTLLQSAMDGICNSIYDQLQPSLLSLVGIGQRAAETVQNMINAFAAAKEHGDAMDGIRAAISALGGMSSAGAIPDFFHTVAEKATLVLDKISALKDAGVPFQKIAAAALAAGPALLLAGKGISTFGGVFSGISGAISGFGGVLGVSGKVLPDSEVHLSIYLQRHFISFRTAEKRYFPLTWHWAESCLAL